VAPRAEFSLAVKGTREVIVLNFAVQCCSKRLLEGTDAAPYSTQQQLDGVSWVRGGLQCPRLHTCTDGEYNLWHLGVRQLAGFGGPNETSRPFGHHNRIVGTQGTIDKRSLGWAMEILLEICGSSRSASCPSDVRIRVFEVLVLDTHACHVSNFLKLLKSTTLTTSPLAVYGVSNSSRVPS
jgi:hypothetical protein